MLTPNEFFHVLTDHLLISASVGFSSRSSLKFPTTHLPSSPFSAIASPPDKKILLLLVLIKTALDSLVCHLLVLTEAAKGELGSETLGAFVIKDVLFSFMKRLILNAISFHPALNVISGIIITDLLSPCTNNTYKSSKLVGFPCAEEV